MVLMRLALLDLASSGLSGPYGQTGQDSQVEKNIKKARISVDIRVITGYTIQNPFWWTSLVVCLVLGYAIALSWSGPPILWIALLVTGLIPAGFLALFITLAVMLEHVSRGHS